MGRSDPMTEGFALGFAWLMFLGLLAVLAYFLLREPR
jgi:hypothetical protein